MVETVMVVVMLWFENCNLNWTASYLLNITHTKERECVCVSVCERVREKNVQTMQLVPGHS